MNYFPPYFVCILGLIFAQFPSASARSTPSRKYLGSKQLSPVTSPLSSPSSLAMLARLTVGYTELGDGQVMEVLSKHLRLFEESQAEEDGEEKGGGDDSPRKNADSVITLYKEAIEHCARLYRVMVSDSIRFWNSSYKNLSACSLILCSEMVCGLYLPTCFYPCY